MRVFISHAHADSRLISSFLRFLESIQVLPQNIFCTSVKGHDVPGAEDFKSYIRKKLKEANIFFVLVSRNYFGSPFCMAELGAIWGEGKKFYPVLLPE